MKIDIQVNGGSGLLFNKIDNLNDFLKIELNHLKKANSFIVPTFITDSWVNMEKFVNLVVERIDLNEKEYFFKNDDVKIILPKLWAVHIEGPFITNKGTHPEKHLKKIDKENIDKLIEVLKPLKKLPIILTLAPELMFDNIDKNIDLIKKLKKELNVVISAGHTKITKEDFKKLQDGLGDDKIKMFTHLHNAMLEGHFKGDVDGAPSYLIEEKFDGYFGLITDGQHTSAGELLPTILNYSDKICITSDCASPACCDIDCNSNLLFSMGGSIGVVEKKENQLPSFFWTDFSKTDNEDVKNKKLSNEKLYDLYIKGEGGYKTLAGSAVNIEECYVFLKNLDIKKELEKSKLNKKTKYLLEIGLSKNNLNENEEDIRNFIDNNIDKMFFENQIKALGLDDDINNYSMIDNKLYKNNVVFIDFDLDFNDVMSQFLENQDNLKEELKNNIDKY